MKNKVELRSRSKNSVRCASSKILQQNVVAQYYLNNITCTLGRLQAEMESTAGGKGNGKGS